MDHGIELANLILDGPGRHYGWCKAVAERPAETLDDTSSTLIGIGIRLSRIDGDWPRIISGESILFLKDRHGVCPFEAALLLEQRRRGGGGSTVPDDVLFVGNGP